jgi:ABC-type glutathione transport system ATPase component
MIEITDPRKSFGAIPVSKGISLRVDRGAVVAIIGPSGSGKSNVLCVSISYKNPTAPVSASATASGGLATVGSGNECRSPALWRRTRCHVGRPGHLNARPRIGQRGPVRDEDGYPHPRDRLAHEVADRIAPMCGSAIVEIGRPEQILEHPGNLRTRGFLANFHQFLGRVPGKPERA